MTLKKIVLNVIPSIVLALGAPGAAWAGLVTNGSFEQTTGGTSGQLGYNGLTATGWSSTGYNFLFTPGSADTTGVTGSNGNLKLWGPGDGSANGLPASSPDGGNYVGADGAYEVGAITQTLTGLTKGDAYAVSFWWGVAQQSGFSGNVTEQWQVSLGGQTLSTPVVGSASHAFSGWMYETITFTADSTSDVLSFLSVGTPTGEPPFALLDGVSANAVPEPSSLVLVGLGLLGAVVVRQRRRARPVVA